MLELIDHGSYVNLNRDIGVEMSESKGSLVVDSDKGIKLEMLSVDSISVNEWNPNEMAAFELNQLAGDVAMTGFLQPILVAPLSGGK